jgi:2-C-methyl-D-erythritol 4-phosphate cytidylyltransferase/2-C-methyl-D-erythritol 2,4-cyclodiphosphate synthase
MRVYALIVAAGRGERAGGEVPKQYRDVAGKSVLRRSIESFLYHPAVDTVCVVTNEDDRERYEAAIEGLRILAPANGGNSRQVSVFNGLKSLHDTAASGPDIVLIHDAARCFVSQGVISRVIEGVQTSGEGAIPALPVSDAIKRGSTHAEESVDRKDLWRAQTPQGFPFEAILKAHEAAAGKSLSDDAAVAEAVGLPVRIVEGDEANIKLTQPQDFLSAEQRLVASEVRTGFGFDVHRFEDGESVILCGVTIPFEKKLKGHSDADVAMHALTDAILGAVAAGDIGDHFPPSDPKWQDAPSEIFLKFAAEKVTAMNGRISHADVTIICEQPRIGPYRVQMQTRLAEILGLSTDHVNVKATTSEGLGFTGREEGIAAQAVATISIGGTP